MKIKQLFYVYGIYHGSILVYIGRTESIENRTQSHNNALNTDFKKDLYKYWREHCPNQDIVLKELYCYNTKVEAKRREMILILQDFFGARTLRQRIPNISDSPFFRYK